MEIIIAKTAGFCFGVKRAVDMAFEQAGTQATYTFGPIIHNEVVAKQLEEKGIFETNDINAQKANKLIIRSHGVSPSVYAAGEAAGAEIVDATCPYVKKIHRLVEKFSKEGYGIIIAGNKEHPEIQGISGWVQGECIVIKTPEEVEELTFDSDKKYLLVAQTTYKKEVLDGIQEALKAKGVNFEVNNTICSATKERQEEAKAIAKEVDVMLVLGSKKSSNTAKLQEICLANCNASYCIAGAEELTKDMVEGCRKVGITAGASTPHLVIEAVVNKLNQF